MHHTEEERNKTLSRAFLEEAINQGDMSAMERYTAPNYVEHQVPAGMASDPEAMQKMMGMMMQAFPDLRYTVEDLVAEGDKTVSRVTASATHQGEYMGVAPTNKQVKWEEIHISRWVDGKLAEHWGVMDMVGLLQQIGAMPQMGMAA